jgi:hypothetical protein
MTMPAVWPPYFFYGIADAGVPNRERVVLQTRTTLNLLGYALIAGIPNGPNEIYPIHDNIFWFPQVTVDANTWIAVHSDKGDVRHTKHEQTGEPLIILHWQREKVMFQNPGVGVAIVKAGEVFIAGRIPTTAPK